MKETAHRSCTHTRHNELHQDHGFLLVCSSIGSDFDVIVVESRIVISTLIDASAI
jgi:hypothetical protein